MRKAANVIWAVVIVLALVVSVHGWRTRADGGAAAIVLDPTIVNSAWTCPADSIAVMPYVPNSDMFTAMGGMIIKPICIRKK